jgi:hypothetical protein
MGSGLEWWQVGGGALATALAGLLVWLRKGRLRLRIRASYRSPDARQDPVSLEPPPHPRRRYDSVEDDG